MLSARIGLSERPRGSRVRTTTLAERLLILAAFVAITVVFQAWWARLAFGLASAVALFNVVAIIWLLRRGKSVPIIDSKYVQPLPAARRRQATVLCASGDPALPSTRDLASSNVLQAALALKSARSGRVLASRERYRGDPFGDGGDEASR